MDLHVQICALIGPHVHAHERFARLLVVYVYIISFCVCEIERDKEIYRQRGRAHKAVIKHWR